MIFKSSKVSTYSDIKRYTEGSLTDFVQETYTVATLGDGSSAIASGFSFQVSEFNGCYISYKIKEQTTNNVRVGTILVATDGVSASVADQYTETSDLGVSWSVAVSGGICQLSYTCSESGNDRVMKADRKLFI